MLLLAGFLKIQKTEPLRLATNSRVSWPFGFNGDLLTGDFMDHNVVNKYDVIVMNPPFGHGGKEAAEHVGKAIKHLNNGGRIVSLIPTGPAADKQFDALLHGEKSSDNIVVSASIELPRVTFERAGTKVSTKILVIDRVDGKDAGFDISPESKSLTLLVLRQSRTYLMNEWSTLCHASY